MTPAPPVTVALYGRVSRQFQADKELSLPGQFAICRDYAARQAWIVTGEYTDILTGHEPERPGYQQLKADARARKFSHVLCWKFDRFGRDEAEYHIALKEAWKLRLEMWSVTEGKPSPLLMSIIVAFAAEESRRISERTRMGRTQAAKQGRYLGKAPFGYARLPKGVLEVDTVTGPVAAELFRRYAGGGCSAHSLSRWLTAQGYRMNGANVWRLLQRPVYMGTLRYNHEIVGRWDARGVRPLEEQTIVPGAVPALVDPALWHAVQERLRLQREAPSLARKPAPGALLTGLVWCECGARVMRHVGGRKGDTMSYLCVRRHDRHECAVPSRVCRRVDDFVLGQVRRLALDEEALDYARTLLAAHARTDPSAERRVAIGRAVAELEARRDRAGDMAVSGTLPADQYARINADLEARLSAHRKELRECAAAAAVDVEALVGRARALTQAPESTTLEERREYMSELISRVIIPQIGEPVILWVYGEIDALLSDG